MQPEPQPNGHPPPGFARIDLAAVYDLATATELIAKPLGLAATTLEREARKGRLRVTRRGGKYLVSGRMLLRWVEGRGARSRAASAR